MGGNIRAEVGRDNSRWTKLEGFATRKLEIGLGGIVEDVLLGDLREMEWRMLL